MKQQRFAKYPRWWQPHENGDNLRSPPTQMFNLACTRTTQDSTYTLDQQEEMATVLAVSRSRQSARNTNAYPPRHTFLSASIRSCLSMSANQNHDIPLRNLVHEGTHRMHASQTWSFFVLDGTDTESSLPETPCVSQWKTGGICSHTNVKLLVRKKDNEISCSIGAVKKVFHPVFQILKKQHHSDHPRQTLR